MGQPDTVQQIVDAVRTEIDRLRADRDAAVESERRIWRAYAMAKGAAERACGVLAMVPGDEFTAQLDQIHDDLCDAERHAGVAVE